MFWLFDVQTTTLTNNNKNYFNNDNYYHQQETKDVDDDNKDAEFISHTKNEFYSHHIRSFFLSFYN